MEAGIGIIPAPCWSSSSVTGEASKRAAVLGDHVHTAPCPSEFEWSGAPTEILLIAA